MLHPYSLYPHLTQDEIDQIIENNKNYDISKNVTESDKLLSQKINEEADLLQPVMSSGWRCSDIDSLSMRLDVRAQNIILSRMKAIPTPTSDNSLTDEQLVESVIPRNLMSSEVSNFATEAITLKENLELALKQFRENESLELAQSSEQSE